MKNIPETIRVGLSNMAQTEFGQQSFDKLSKLVFINLVGEENNTKAIDQFKENDRNCAAEEYFNWLLLFTVQCLKKQLTDLEVCSFLLEFGFDQQSVDGFSKKLQQFRNFILDPENVLIAANFESKIHFDHLVDLDWQQEIIVSSKYANKVYQEVYKIQLHTKDEKAIDKNIVFKCTLPQLIEISNKLGVILKNVEQNQID